MAQAADSALYSARLRFVEGLPARAQELSSTAERLARDPDDSEAAVILRRRLHALLASAQVFEERALSLAVQDLIARLDETQRSERPFSSEELDAVSVVVASLPTYVRPTSLPPPAAYSDVRELRNDTEMPTQPLAPGLLNRPEVLDALLVDLPLSAAGERKPLVLVDAGLARSRAADLRPPPQELSIDVALPPSEEERAAIAALDRELGIEPEDSHVEAPTFARTDQRLLGDSRAALELPTDDGEVLIDWTSLSEGTAESLPPIEPHARAESGIYSALPEAEPELRDSAVVAALEPRPVALMEPENVADETTDPGLGPPVLLDQTVSGLSAPRPAVLLVVGELEQSDLQLSAAEIELVHAQSADEAVRLLHETSPDLVLVSADLAGKPGADLVRRLKNDPLTPAADVRLLLPEAGVPDQLLVEQTGADGVVWQPLTAGALEPTLRLAVAQRLGLREVSVDAIAAQIAEEIRRGIAESLRAGKPTADGTELMAAAWSAIGRVRSHLAEQSRERVRRHDDDGSLLPDAAEHTLHPSQLLAGCRVLVADDDPAVLWFFVGLLREASATVFQAHNGREALELARRKQPHVIVSDILMPKLDGFGLCRELKRDALLARVPVVLLSWKDDLLQCMRELDSGAAGYLRKEAGSQQILGVICDVLAARTQLAAQLRAPGDVRGTLERLGPWTLLELVAASRADAHVVVRDASNIFEVEVRSGRRLAVTRTAADGAFTRGEKALMQLIGLGAGEFEVSSGSTPLRAALSEPLDRALAAAGRRVSALLDSVSDARLLRVSLIAFDDEVLQSLLAASSTRLPEVVALFRTGNATAEGLLREGQFAPAELEQYLRELARGLAITGVWSADGDDLVAAAQRERETPQLTLLTSSSPPRARVDEQAERATPVMAIDPIQLEPQRKREDDTLVGLAPPQTLLRPSEETAQDVGARVSDGAHEHEHEREREAEVSPRFGNGTVLGLGPPAPAAEPEPEPEPDLDALTAHERQASQPPLARRRDRSEGLRLMATLFGLAALGYFGWQQLTLRKLNELRPAALEMTTETASAPVASPPPPEPAEPALPNTQLGRILPFVDHSRGVEVGSDQGLLVLEYHSTDPAPSVRVGARELGRPPLAVALPAGRHELVVRAGKATSIRYLIVRAGETRIVGLPLAEL